MDKVARSVRIVTRHLNVSASRRVTPEAFASVLSTGIVDDLYRDHLVSFFDEATSADFADLVAQGASSFERLANLAKTVLPEGHQSRAFLDERA